MAARYSAAHKIEAAFDLIADIYGARIVVASERKKAERARNAAAGLVRFEDWIYPADREKVKRYLKRLRERSEKGKAPNEY